jgi:PAS domain S-box-containing protein
MAPPELITREPTSLTEGDWSFDASSFNRSFDPVLVVSSDGLILFANRAAQRTFRIEASDLVGQPIADLVPADLRSKHDAGLEAFFKDPVPQILGSEFGLFAQRADGERFPVEIVVGPLNRGASAYCIVREMVDAGGDGDGTETHRRRLEELVDLRTVELRERTLQLEREATAIQSIVDSMSEGVVVAGLDGHFRFFNAAARRLLGKGPTDKPASEWSKVYGILLPDRETLVPGEQMPVVRALAGEEVDSSHFFVRTPELPNGFYISVSARPIRDQSGVTTGAVAVFRNISDQKRTEAELREAREELERRVVERTLSLARANRELNMEIEERRQAENALQASERQLRLMADSLPVLIAYVDSRQRYVFHNASYRQWFDLSDDEMRGKPVWEAVGIERYKIIRPFIEQALSGRTVVTDLEVDNAEMGLRQLQMNLVPDRDDLGAVQGFYAVGVDVTDRHDAEAMERKHREELAHVSRVTTMGELTAALAHELNQPLTSIRSNAQAALRLMETDQVVQSDLVEILSDIIDDDRRASEVIRRLRAMLRKRPMTLETLELDEVVSETVSMVSSDAIMRGVAVEVQMNPEMPSIRADRIQLQQVLLNLIMNGFDAMRDRSGSKKLSIRSMCVAENEVCVCVSDEGSGLHRGMDPQNVFQPFYSTKEHGMGMGLSISRSIIEAMGGRIWVVDNEDTGVTFHFTVPVA